MKRTLSETASDAGSVASSNGDSKSLFTNKSMGSIFRDEWQSDVTDFLFSTIDSGLPSNPPLPPAGGGGISPKDSKRKKADTSLLDLESNPDLSFDSKLKDDILPRKWSKEEDERLRLAVADRGESNWKEIAKLVGSRNHVQCLQRWKKVLTPGLVKGQWSAQEDTRLVMLVSKGFKNWGQLASQMQGRTSKQCRERWCHHLDPSVKKGDYTDDEDQKILLLQNELGNKWAEISKQLPGRTENAVKIRWKALDRAKNSSKKTKLAQVRCRNHPDSRLKALAAQAAVCAMTKAKKAQCVNRSFPAGYPRIPDTIKKIVETDKEDTKQASAGNPQGQMIPLMFQSLPVVQIPQNMEGLDLNGNSQNNLPTVPALQSTPNVQNSVAEVQTPGLDANGLQGIQAGVQGVNIPGFQNLTGTQFQAQLLGNQFQNLNGVQIGIPNVQNFASGNQNLLQNQNMVVANQIHSLTIALQAQLQNQLQTLSTNPAAVNIPALQNQLLQVQLLNNQLQGLTAAVTGGSSVPGLVGLAGMQALPVAQVGAPGQLGNTQLLGANGLAQLINVQNLAPPQGGLAMVGPDGNAVVGQPAQQLQQPHQPQLQQVQPQTIIPTLQLDAFGNIINMNGQGFVGLPNGQGIPAVNLPMKQDELAGAIPTITVPPATHQLQVPGFPGPGVVQNLVQAMPQQVPGGQVVGSVPAVPGTDGGGAGVMTGQQQHQQTVGTNQVPQLFVPSDGTAANPQGLSTIVLPDISGQMFPQIMATMGSAPAPASATSTSTIAFPQMTFNPNNGTMMMANPASGAMAMSTPTVPTLTSAAMDFTSMGVQSDSVMMNMTL